MEYEGIRPDTQRMLDGQESRQVDFKRGPEGLDPEDLVAFANAAGGTILVGVDEATTDQGLQRGRVVGCEISDQVRVGFLNKASSCRPPVGIEVAIENLATRPFYRLDIPEGSRKPYCTEKGTYKIRSDGRNVAIDPNMMTTLILERETEQFVRRFQAAAEAVIRNLSEMEARLGAKLSAIESVAEKLPATDREEGA